MSNDLITFDVPMDEAAAAWWVDRFRVGDRTLYPEQLAARIAQGLPGKLRCHFTSVLPAQGRVSLELHGADDSMNRLWFLGETLWFEPDQHLFHDLVEVVGALRGGGIGKRMMRNCFSVAQDVGLEEMRLKASWVGAYAWLRFGFTPSRRDWENEMKARLVEKVLEYKPQLAPAAFNGLLRLLSSDKPRAAWLIADDRTPVVVEGIDGPVPLGRAVLSETKVAWNGTLAFDDEEAVDRFKTYVER